MRVRYTGLPGYQFFPASGGVLAPKPGDVLDLDAEVVASLGADFVPVVEEKATKAAKASTPVDDTTPTGQEG